MIFQPWPQGGSRPQGSILPNSIPYLRTLGVFSMLNPTRINANNIIIKVETETHARFGAWSSCTCFILGSVSSEELIKYAHKISSSNAVEAPTTWMPGMASFSSQSVSVLGFLCLYTLSIHSKTLFCNFLSSNPLTLYWFELFPSCFPPGDPRRPYPLDVEMRSGILGLRVSDGTSIGESFTSGQENTLASAAAISNGITCI